MTGEGFILNQRLLLQECMLAWVSPQRVNQDAKLEVTLWLNLSTQTKERCPSLSVSGMMIQPISLSLRENKSFYDMPSYKDCRRDLFRL